MHHVPRNRGQHEYDVAHMVGTASERLVLAIGAALVAAILTMLGACIGVALASAPQTDCSGLQAALDTAGSGATVVLDGMCTGSYTLPAGATFTLEGAPDTTSGFDGAGAVNPLLGTIGSEEAGAVTINHLTFEHANLQDASALSIRASRVTLSDDSFLDNEEHGETAHAAFISVGTTPSSCPSAAGTTAITLTGSTFLNNRLVLGSGAGGGAGAWIQDECPQSRTVLEGNSFEGNVLEAAGTPVKGVVSGGGLQFVGSKTQPVPVSQRGNVFDSDKLVASAPAEADYGGGGEWLEYASLRSVDDRFSRDSVPGTAPGAGSHANAWSWGGLGV